MQKITAIFRVPDMSREQYDKVMADLDKAGMYKVPARPFHVMSLAEKGSVVVDVWDSQEALNEFFVTLGPILIKNGINPPQPEIYPVHNTVA